MFLKIQNFFTKKPTFSKIVFFIFSFIFFIVLFFLFIKISFAEDPNEWRNKYDYVSDSDFFSSSTSKDFSTEPQDISSLGGLFTFLFNGAYIAAIVVIIYKLIFAGWLKVKEAADINSQKKANEIIKVAGWCFAVLIIMAPIATFINPKLLSWNLTGNAGADKIEGGDSEKSETTGGGSCSTCNESESKYTDTQKTDLFTMLGKDEAGAKKEGFYSKAYKDTTDHLTIGIGFNLEQANAKEILTASKINKSLNDLKSGSATINAEEAKKILDVEIKEIEDRAKIQLGDYYTKLDKNKPLDKLKINWILNFLFNGNCFSRCSNSHTATKDLVIADKWDKVAAEIQNSNYCGQVGCRCPRLANLAKEISETK